jgi:hypothetical protein
VAGAVAGAAPAANRVDLVDEHDGGCRLPGLGEQIAHPACPDTHEHLDEIRARKAEERHAGQGAGEQRLAHPRPALEQHPPRHHSTQRLEAFRAGEERLELLELGAELVDPGDVGKAGPDPAGLEHLRLGPADAEQAAATHTLARDEQEHAHDDEGGQERDEHTPDGGRRGFHLDPDAVSEQGGHQAEIEGRDDAGSGPVGGGRQKGIVLDHHPLDRLCRDAVAELRVGHDGQALASVTPEDEEVDGKAERDPAEHGQDPKQGLLVTAGRHLEAVLRSEGMLGLLAGGGGAARRRLIRRGPGRQRGRRGSRSAPAAWQGSPAA